MCLAQYVCFFSMDLLTSYSKELITTMYLLDVLLVTNQICQFLHTKLNISTLSFVFNDLDVFDF